MRTHTHIAEVLGEREPTAGEAGAFWYRGQNIDSLGSQARDAIAIARTQLRWNPRRLLLQSTPPIAAYTDLAAQMVRAGEAMRSITDILRRLPGATEDPDQEFLRRYGAFLREVCCAVALVVDLDPEDMETVRGGFEEHLERARDHYKDPAPRPESDDGLRLVYDGLLLEAERILTELDAARDALR